MSNCFVTNRLKNKNKWLTPIQNPIQNLPVSRNNTFNETSIFSKYFCYRIFSIDSYFRSKPASCWYKGDKNTCHGTRTDRFNWSYFYGIGISTVDSPPGYRTGNYRYADRNILHSIRCFSGSNRHDNPQSCQKNNVAYKFLGKSLKLKL